MAITLGTLTAKTGMTLPWRHGSVTRRGSAGLVAAGIAVVGFACIAMWVKLEETRGSLTAASGVSPAPDARHPPALIGVWQLGIDSVSGDAYIISLANRGVMVQLHDRQVECSRYDEGRRTLRAGWCHSPEVLGTGAWHATASELCIDYSWYAVFPGHAPGIDDRTGALLGREARAHRASQQTGGRPNSFSGRTSLLSRTTAPLQARALPHLVAEHHVSH